MDYAAMAHEAHCLDSAIEDIVRRCESRFQGDTPTSQAVQQWLTQTLRTTAPHLFAEAQPLWAQLGLPSQEAFDKLDPGWRSTQAREHGQGPPLMDRSARRPTYRTLTAQELAALDAEGLSWAARREKARVLQQTPLPPG
jgi:hypothetical protein